LFAWFIAALTPERDVWGEMGLFTKILIYRRKRAARMVHIRKHEWSGSGDIADEPSCLAAGLRVGILLGLRRVRLR